METFAVIRTGGKQYVVHKGDVVNVEKLSYTGKSVTLSDVLLVGGDQPRIGTPSVSGATVQASVIEDGRAKKITVVKYKPKVRYRRKTGHRQAYTKIRIEKITA